MKWQIRSTLKFVSFKNMRRFEVCGVLKLSILQKKHLGKICGGLIFAEVLCLWQNLSIKNT